MCETWSFTLKEEHRLLTENVQEQCANKDFWA